jgi:WD40 repeat protein
VATGSDRGVIKLWDVETGRRLASLKGHTATIWSIAFSADGLTLATGSDDCTVKLWDVGIGQERMTLKGHTSSIASVLFSPDDKTLATASGDGTVKLWHVANDQDASALTTDPDLDEPEGWPLVQPRSPKGR